MCYRVVGVLLLIIALIWQVTWDGGISAMAQGPKVTKWSAPTRISQSGNFAYLPFIVADQSGTLHVVWSESVADPLNELALDTIFYATRRGYEWSKPIDIFAVSEPATAVVNRLRLDRSGVLTLLWVDRAGHIVLAIAPSTDAGSARAWKAVQVSEPAWLADFAFGRDGAVHLVYVLDRQGIFYAQSGDGGATWSVTSTVWNMPTDQYSSGSVRIEVGPDGTIHVAWGLTAASMRWNPVGVLYARSTDNGRNWETTLNVQEGDNLPSIGFDAQANLHLVWNNPAASMMGRGHAWSTDSGVTWKGPERIFPGYRGQTMWPAMAQDSAGTLHLITCANPPTAGVSQTFHTEWQGESWSGPQAISGEFYGGEGPSVAVSGGNQLHVVWFSYGGHVGSSQYGIYYAMGQGPAPSVSFQPKAELLPTATASPSVPTPTAVSPSPTRPIVSSSVVKMQMVDGSFLTHSAELAFLAGLVPVMLLIAVVLFVQASKKR